MIRSKGNSVIETLNDYVVIDLETTGLDPAYDEIIELGAIKIQNGLLKDSFQSLVKPSFPIDEFISELTGITNEMVSNAPSIRDAMPEFINFIGTNVVVGHNINFDINFIYDNWFRISGKAWSNDYIDTMRLSRRVLPSLEHHRLKDLTAFYKIKHDGAHRSISDCIATNDLYLRLCQEIREKGLDIKYINKKKSLRAADILATVEPDVDSPILKKTVVFTGTLVKMVRKDAMQIVVNLGGINCDNVTKKTNYLVIGNGDYSCVLKDGKSNKHKKAEYLIEKGADLQIISEDVFFDMIGMVD